MAADNPEVEDGWHESWDRVNEDGFDRSHRWTPEMYAKYSEADPEDYYYQMILKKDKADERSQAELRRLTLLYTR